MKMSLLFAAFLMSVMSPVRPLHAQTPVTKNFDSTKPITLTGVVAGLTLFRDRSYLIVDLTDGLTNTVQRWAIQGNDRNLLIEAGWNFGTSLGAAAARDGFRPITPYVGEMVTVVAYRPQPNIDIQAILGDSPAVIGGAPAGLPPDSPFAKLARGNLNVDLRELFKVGRFVYGTEVTFSDGNKLVFGRVP
jgi:hypothetical protein